MSGPYVHFVFDIDYALRMEVISTWWLKSKKRKDGESEDEMKRKEEREDLPDSIKYAARYPFATDITSSRVFVTILPYYFLIIFGIVMLCFVLFLLFPRYQESGPGQAKEKCGRKC